MKSVEEIKEFFERQGIQIANVVAIVYVRKPSDLMCNFIFAPNDHILVNWQQANLMRNMKKLMSDLAMHNFKIRKAPIQPAGTPPLTLNSFRLRVVK